MNAMLELELLVGLGAVAVWTHVNYPRLRPASLVRAVVHVGFSFCAFALMPTLLSALASRYLGLTVLFPVVTYLLLSWVWLLARILDLLDGTPRGGLPVEDES